MVMKNNRSNSNIDLQKSNSCLQGLIEQHKPLLSFRERVDAGLGMQPGHTSLRNANSKSPSHLNLDLLPLQQADLTGRADVVSNSASYVKDLEHKLLKVENKCAKLERSTSSITGGLSTHRRDLETNFAREMKA